MITKSMRDRSRSVPQRTAARRPMDCPTIELVSKGFGVSDNDRGSDTSSAGKLNPDGGIRIDQKSVLRHKPPVRRHTQTALCALGVIAIDLGTKLAAQIDRGHRSGPVVPVHNPSFSLGVLHGPRTVELNAMLLIIIAVALYLGRLMRAGRVSGWIAGLLLGGASANFIDRSVSGSVHDFLAARWVVFNVADVAVLVGLGGCVIAVWRTQDTRNHAAAPLQPNKGERR